MDLSLKGVCQIQRKVRGFVATKWNPESLGSKSARQVGVQLCLLDSLRQLLLGCESGGVFGGNVRRLRSRSFSGGAGDLLGRIELQGSFADVLLSEIYLQVQVKS